MPSTPAKVLLVSSDSMWLVPNFEESALELLPANRDEAIETARRSKPDAAIIDLRDGSDGVVPLVQELLAALPSCVVGLVGEIAGDERDQAFEAGAAELISPSCSDLERAKRIERIVKQAATTRRRAELQYEVESLRERRTHLSAQLDSANQEVRRISNTDPLMGVNSQRRFHEVLEQEWKRALRASNPITLLILDPDQFRLYNERYGHTTGDDRLAQIARAIQSGLNRAGDFVARYGGAELVVLLPNTDAMHVEMLARRLADKVRELAIPHESAAAGVLTMSVGGATIVPSPTSSPAMLLAAAEKALSDAKEAGRDRVAVHHPQ